MQTNMVTLKKYMVLFHNIYRKKVPIGKSTNMVLFPKEKVPYSTWYFFFWYFFLLFKCAWRHKLAMSHIWLSKNSNSDKLAYEHQHDKDKSLTSAHYSDQICT